jgi:hypothetical protein
MIGCVNDAMWVLRSDTAPKMCANLYSVFKTKYTVLDTYIGPKPTFFNQQ